jgi:hypothetical protein
MIEVSSIDEFDARVATGSLAGLAVQSLDLCDRSEALLHHNVDGAVFLGCIVEPAVQRRLIRDAIVFPRFPDLPFGAFRSSPYTPEELFREYRPGHAESVEDTLDTRVYRWFEQGRTEHDIV